MEEPRTRTPGSELKGPRQVSLLAVITTVLALALVGFGADRAFAWRSVNHDDDRGREAVNAASAEVTALTTVSAKTSKADIQRLLDGATAGFRDEFAKQTNAFVKALQTGNVTSTGQVVSAGLTSLDDDSATVLVAASGTVVNTQSKTPEPRNYRLKVDLKYVSNQWLVSGLEFVA